MGNNKSKEPDLPAVLSVAAAQAKKTTAYRRKQVIFSQGMPANTVFYIVTGKIDLTVLSPSGKEAVIAILGAGDFLGEECLGAGSAVRISTATCLEDSTVMRIGKAAMVRGLEENPALLWQFIAYLLSRNRHLEEDLMDQLLNCSERRLARTLLFMAEFPKNSTKQYVAIPRLKQEILAQMVGTTRSRISTFMSRFRKLGLIRYEGKLLIVNRALVGYLQKP